MKLKIKYSSEAEGQIGRLDRPMQIRIINKMSCLKNNPFTGKPLGNRFKNNRSLRIGKYRAIYCIEGSDIIIAKIARRKKAYR